MGESGSNRSPARDPLSFSLSPSDVATHKRHILVIEDNRADLVLILEALETKLNAEIRSLIDGEQAFRFFDEADHDLATPCPDLVILDVNLPRRSGSQVLAHIRDSGRCAGVPVMVVTSSDSAKDREEMSGLGISAYFRKPSEFDEYMKLGDIAHALLTAP